MAESVGKTSSGKGLPVGEEAQEASLDAEAIVGMVQQPLLVLTGDLRVETANPAFYRSFKVDPAGTEGHLIYALGNSQWNIPRLRELLEEILSQNSTIQDFRVEHDFEQIGHRVMLLNATRMKHGGGADRILLAITDITERERCRFELEGQKEFAEKIIDASREALLILDWDLRVKSANETFYTTFKVDPAQTEGRLVYELGNGQWNIPRLRELLENVLPDNDAFNDFEVEHAFEQIGYRLMVLNARRIDHMQLILLAIEDITERRRSVLALAESEARFRVLVEAASQAVWETDAQGSVVADSPSWRAYTGQRLEEWLGDGWVQAVHPEDRAYAERQWREAVAAGRTVDAEFRLRSPDGRWRWTNVRAAPLRDPTGTIMKWVGMNLDINARKEAEAERELLLGELNHRVKNLFAVIRALAAQGDARRPATEYRDVFLGRLDALVRAHKLALEGQWRSTDLRTLVERALEPYAAGRPQTVEVNGDPVELDPRRALSLSLVLHELATNAVKYGALSEPDGRVRLTWRLVEEGENRRVRLEWEEGDGPVVTPPQKGSFGTRLIHRVFSYELHGGAELMFQPEGLCLKAWFPLS